MIAIVRKRMQRYSVLSIYRFFVRVTIVKVCPCSPPLLAIAAPLYRSAIPSHLSATHPCKSYVAISLDIYDTPIGYRIYRRACVLAARHPVLHIDVRPLTIRQENRFLPVFHRHCQVVLQTEAISPKMPLGNLSKSIKNR